MSFRRKTKRDPAFKKQQDEFKQEVLENIAKNSNKENVMLEYFLRSVLPKTDYNYYLFAKSKGGIPINIKFKYEEYISENFEVVAASLNKKDLKGLGCAIIRVYNNESAVFWDTIAETFVNVFNKKFNRKFLLDCGFQKNPHGFYVNVTDAGKIMFEINYIDLPY